MRENLNRDLHREVRNEVALEEGPDEGRDELELAEPARRQNGLEDVGPPLVRLYRLQLLRHVPGDGLRVGVVTRNRVSRLRQTLNLGIFVINVKWGDPKDLLGRPPGRWVPWPRVGRSRSRRARTCGNNWKVAGELHGPRLGGGLIRVGLNRGDCFRGHGAGS